jgi:hypothetical protein
MADRTVAILSSAKALRVVGAGAARGIFSKPVTEILATEEKHYVQPTDCVHRIDAAIVESAWSAAANETEAAP